MRKDFALLAAGRFAQALLTIAALRVLTALLSPAEVGSVYLILSLAAVFGLFFINPVGMYINRRLHAWQQEKRVLSRFYLFNFYVAGVAALSLGMVGAAKYFFGIGSQLDLFPLLVAVAFYVYASTWNMTAVPSLNLLGFRVPFVILSVLTSGLALAGSYALAVRAFPTAFYWICGQAAAMLFVTVIALYALRDRLSEEVSLSVSGANLQASRGVWLFALPLAGATLFMWVQNQSYRIIVEKMIGPDYLGFLAVGLGIAASLAAVTESLVQQVYFPDFYKKLNSSGPEARKAALVELTERSLPVYVILTAFVISVSSQLTSLLVDKAFARASVFVAFGAVVELFRMTANILAASAHAEMRTAELIKPYALGGIFTAAGVALACYFRGGGYFIPAAMAAGGLVTVVSLKRGIAKDFSRGLDYSVLAKAGAYSVPFLLLLPLKELHSLNWSILLLAVSGSYFLLLQYFAAFKWRPVPPAEAAPVPASHPLVCVCMPAYNSATTIEKSLKSVLAQTYRNIRVVVVDNASTDDTARIVEACAKNDPRVELVRNPVNVGGENNFTRCIQLASGEYTAIYHADDLYEPAMVETAVRFMEENPRVGVVFTSATEIDSAGNCIGGRGFPPELYVNGSKSFPFETIFRMVLRYGNFLTFPSALVRTEIYKGEIREWDGGQFKTSADLDVWFRIAEKHEVGLIDRPLMQYRVSSASFSYTYSRLRTGRQDLFLVLAHYVRKHRALMDSRARSDYRLLILKDDISIAINQVIRGERDAAFRSLRGIFSPVNILASVRNRRQFKLLMVGYAAFAAAALPLTETGRNVLAKVRHKG